NNALAFSIAAQGIFEDDRWPSGLKDIPNKERRGIIYQHIKALKERDPEKYNYLFQTDMLDMIHPRAYKAIATPHGMLEVHAARLRLNLQDVTPTALARELKISVSTLYRRFGREAIKNACRPAPERDESPTSVRINKRPLGGSVRYQLG